MTEADWLSCSSPQVILAFLWDHRSWCVRKSRLFAIACCRWLIPLTENDPSRTAALGVTSSVQADFLRDIFGNPFRPATLAPSCLTPVVLALARGIYDDRAFDRLPILADALEDAGCGDAELLGHLRSSGTHVRGCWAVDLVLGKE